jgi:hypothetical protein
VLLVLGVVPSFFIDATARAIPTSLPTTSVVVSAGTDPVPGRTVCFFPTGVAGER